MKLSPHFSLEEFTYSSTALARGIDNSLNPENPAHAKIISNLRNLCEQVLEPLRTHVNEPITISSGYRCPKLNSHPEVRGASNSKHLLGEAADIHLPSIDTGRKYIEFILDNCVFDHLIWEHDSHGNYWIHVSITRTGKNRQLYTPNLLKK